MVAPYLPGWFIFLSPAIGAPVSLIVGRHKRFWAGIIASLSILISLILTYVAFVQVGTSGPIQNQYLWFFNINVGVYIDNLALVMAFMVSFVSLMIHLFALYYMGKDPNKHVYFAETALFTAGMLGLVVSSNLVEFFLFWELVGLCSYLLIGFWYFKPNATSAAKKAFIVTRVGDLLFLVGMAVLYESLIGYTFSPQGTGPLDIPFLISHAASVASYIGATRLGIVAVLFLAGAAGKSSQFPLHVWISDAMEGPTTVSALIHAATMVTAGVYLVARVFPLYYYSAPFAVYSVIGMGAFTAVFAGIVGIFVNDIKRILAYSTISQLGYMLSAIGIGALAFPAVAGSVGYEGVALGIFHLISHALFKALLFMSAGAILIALMDLRDTREMGGLWRRMPVTVTLLFIGSLSLVAFPGTTGYFSKDAIISAAWDYHLAFAGVAAYLPWILLVTGSFLTTVYTFRMFFRVALGKPRSHLAEHARDPRLLALLPLIPLAAGALVLGPIQGLFYGFLDPSSLIPSVPFAIESVPVILLAAGIALTYILYGTDRWKHISVDSNPLYRVAKNKFYLDYAFTNIIAERVIAPISGAFTAFEDAYNSAVDAFGSATSSFGTTLRRIQDG
ncbi:NADH-quinone oxidoreductase subunit L, partial [Thermoplasmatales archaeon AK]|nr:NADH-quinone oxidoreductase subunit L [Thermoplasmatales archaeon AK]